MTQFASKNGRPTSSWDHPNNVDDPKSILCLCLDGFGKLRVDFETGTEEKAFARLMERGSSLSDHGGREKGNSSKLGGLAR